MSTVDQARIDAFRAKIEQRKACEKKAFHTSMQLIEEEKVNDDTLMNAAVFIDQERYRGVNEDRSMREICGYPLCSNKLAKDIPKNQYHINVKLNKVIDTTERRFFCSVFCYKASKYFERQIPTSPVWAREQEVNSSYKVDLLTPETLNKAQEDRSTVISQATYSRSMPKTSRHRDSSSSSSNDDEEDEFERLQQARDEYYKSRMKFKPKSTLVERKLEQVPLPDFIRTQNKTIDFVMSCLYEWFSDRTRDFLRNDQTTPSSIDPFKYQQLVNRLDVEDMMSSESGRGEKKPPTIDELKKTTEQQQYELKVKEFFLGKDEPKKDQEAAPSTVILPPIDAYSQQTIRLSIVNEKIMTCFKQIFVDGISLTIVNDLRTAVSELLLTFNYTGENIALKPNEWTIMTLFLIHLLTIKLPVVTTHFGQSKIVGSLLQTLNLSSDMIMHIVKYFLNNPIENMILTQRADQTVLKDLFESEAIDIEKLKQYIQKNSVLAELKPLCWEVLLGIKSPYRATRSYVDQANTDVYKRLHSTLTTCRIINNSTPVSEQFLSMYLLDTHTAKLPISSTKDYEAFLSISNVICSFLDSDNEQKLDTMAECWFMTSKIYDKFVHLTRRITSLRYHTGKIAQQIFSYEPKLLLHLNTHNIFACIPESWLRDGFQLIKDDIALLNIWEKFLAGSEYIFAFLTVHILHHCRLKLLNSHSTKEMMQYLTDLKIEDQAECEHIVMASIASWKKRRDPSLDFPPMNN